MKGFFMNKQVFLLLFKTWHYTEMGKIWWLQSDLNGSLWNQNSPVYKSIIEIELSFIEQRNSPSQTLMFW